MASRDITTRVVITGTDGASPAFQKMAGSAQKAAEQMTRLMSATNALNSRTLSASPLTRALTSIGTAAQTAQAHVGRLRTALSAVAAIKLPMGMTVGGAAGMAATIGMTTGAKEAMDADAKLKKLKAFSQASDAEIDDYLRKSREASNRLGLPYEQFLDAALAGVQANVKLKTLTANVDTTAEIAKFSGTEMSHVAPHTYGILRAAGMDYTDPQQYRRVEQMLAVASKHYSGGLDKLVEALLPQVSVKTMAGHSLEAIIGDAIAGRAEGFDSGTIGHALKAFEQRLLNPPINVQSQLGIMHARGAIDLNRLYGITPEKVRGATPELIASLEAQGYTRKEVSGPIGRALGAYKGDENFFATADHLANDIAGSVAKSRGKGHSLTAKDRARLRAELITALVTAAGGKLDQGEYDKLIDTASVQQLGGIVGAGHFGTIAAYKRNLHEAIEARKELYALGSDGKDPLTVRVEQVSRGYAHEMKRLEAQAGTLWQKLWGNTDTSQGGIGGVIATGLAPFNAMLENLNKVDAGPLQAAFLAIGAVLGSKALVTGARALASPWFARVAPAAAGLVGVGGIGALTARGASKAMIARMSGAGAGMASDLMITGMSGVGLAATTARLGRLAGLLSMTGRAARFLGRATMGAIAIEGLTALIENWSKVKALFADPIHVSFIWPELPKWLKGMIEGAAKAETELQRPYSERGGVPVGIRDAWARLHGRNWFQNYDDDLDGMPWASGRFSPGGYNAWLRGITGGDTGGAAPGPSALDRAAQQVESFAQRISDAWGRYVEPMYFDREGAGYAPVGSGADRSGAFSKDDFNSWYGASRDFAQPIVEATTGVQGSVVDAGSKVDAASAAIVAAIQSLGPTMAAAIATAGPRFGGPASASQPAGGNATGIKR